MYRIMKRDGLKVSRLARPKNLTGTLPHGLCLAILAGAIFGTGSPSPSFAQGTPIEWLQERYLKTHMELNVPLRQGRPVGDRFDVTKFQEAIRESRLQVVTVFAKDAYGNAFFKTQHGYFDPGLKFDLVAQEVQALHALGIKVLTHYSVGDDSHIDLYHPDWLCKDINGKPSPGGVLSNRACLNSPYREQMLLPQLEELARLGLDGLWLDIWASPRDCFCQSCRQKFREKYGADLTPDDPRRYQFWWDSWEQALVDVNHRVRAINPNIAITYNGAHLLSHAQRGLVNFFTSESHVNATTGYEDHQIQARYLRPLGIPFDILNMTNIERWDDSTLKSETQLELEFSQAIAQGGRVSAGTQLYPWGEYEHPVAAVLGQACQFIEKRLPFVKDSQSMSYAAVLVRDGEPGEGFYKATSDPGLIGTFTALSGLHTQFDILEADNGGYGLLSRYKLAILPNPEATLEAPDGQRALQDFLQKGGKILLISSDAPPSEKLLRSLGLQTSSNKYGEVQGELGSPGGSAGFPFRGNVVTLEGPKLRDLVTLRTPSGELSAVSLITNQIGYIAWPLGRAFYETGYPEWRGFLKTALSALGPEVPYEIQGPANLDVNMMERKSEFLMHIVNAPIQKGLPGLMPHVWSLAPISDIPVSVRCPRPREVVLEPEGRPLKFDYQGNTVHFTIPEVRIYAIVRIKWE